MASASCKALYGSCHEMIEGDDVAELTANALEHMRAEHPDSFGPGGIDRRAELKVEAEAAKFFPADEEAQAA